MAENVEQVVVDEAADQNIGFFSRFPDAFYPIFSKWLDLKTKNLLRLISRSDRDIVDSVKLEIDVMTFYDGDSFLTAQKHGEEECFLKIKEWDAQRVSYILKTCDVKEFRFMTPPSNFPMMQIDRLIEWNSLYIQDFRCEQFDENAFLFLKKCIAGQMKNITLNMSHPPMSIDRLFYVPAVTYARKFHMIHREDAPVQFFDFIKRWVEHANLKESAGRKIISEGHTMASIDTFVNLIKNGFNRKMNNARTLSNVGVLKPNDYRFFIIFLVKNMGLFNVRVTAVVVPKATKESEYHNYFKLPEDEEKEAENDENAIDIEKKDESINFEKDCSFIDPVEIP